MSLAVQKTFLFFAAVFLFTLPLCIFAQTPTIVNPPVAFNVIVTNVIGDVLNILWAISGAFVTIMFVMAGFKFLTAHGDASKIADARRMVIWGVLGTAVIILAWSATTFVFQALFI